MRRILALIVTACLCFSLAGCQPAPAPAEPATVPTTQPTQPPQIPTTLPAPLVMDPVDIRETTPAPLVEELAQTDFVLVKDYIPDIHVDLKYATKDNFTGRVIYEFTDVYLRYGTVIKLMEVQQELAGLGLSLKIWDGFRPQSAQWRLWEVYPDPSYVSHPVTGGRTHCRGNTVDVTLVDRAGTEVEMPTGFDDFSAKADRDYSDCSDSAAVNAGILQHIMEKHGFEGLQSEWWHFSDETDYELDEAFDPINAAWYYADCNEYINIREIPSVEGRIRAAIPVNEQFRVFGWYDRYALMEYNGMRGYVNRDYIAAATVGNVEAVPSQWVANCEEYISLRKYPDSANILTSIPRDYSMHLVGWNGKYANVEYEGMSGYVLSSYIKPLPNSYFSDCLKVVQPTDCYTYEQMQEDIITLLRTYPGSGFAENIGSSEEDRSITVLVLGDENAEHHILFQGAIHGREHMTAWLLMAMADYTMGQGLPENVCIHIIPMVNPDGVTISQTETLGDIQEEIRAANAGGDPRAYARSWKANAYGIDLNRNFPVGWHRYAPDDPDAPANQFYKGESPFCANETQVLERYTLAHPFDATISYHASGSVIYEGYGENSEADRASSLLAIEVNETTGYPLAELSGEAEGGYKEWCVAELAIPSITIEVGCGSAPLDEREIYSIFARNAEVIRTVADWVKQ